MATTKTTLERLKETYLQDGLLPVQGQGLRWRWYHGVIFYGLVQGLTFGLGGLVGALRSKDAKKFSSGLGDPSYFRRLNQVVFAPPPWVFGPAWTINNLSTIWGNLRVLNKPKGTKGRETFLALQAASWFDFVIFSAAYFGLRSPINAFVLTFGMLVLTLISGFVAIFQLKDSKVALSLATLTIWLLLASTLAAFQVAWNHDEFYDKGPFAKPIEGLKKQNP